MTESIYDTVVIGGGPAGAAAAVYTARKKMTTLLLTPDFGGQSLVSSSIENWIGETNITGLDLAEKLEKHVRAQEGMEVHMPERVNGVTNGPECTFLVQTEKEGKYRSKTLIIASGSRHRRLGVPGEDEFDGKGVAFCSTCDAPMFKNVDVAVVGSGNSALETVLDLVPYAETIHLLLRGDGLKGDPITQQKVAELQQVHVIKNVEVREILGNQSVTGLHYREKTTGQQRELSVRGVFVQIGSVPNSEFVRELVETNEMGEILIDHQTARTSMPGIFAAGDVTNDPYKQNNIAAGDGVRAALSAYHYILNIKRYSPCAEGGD
jgi:alkyl hydroperoxide reductase subunit F